MLEWLSTDDEDIGFEEGTGHVHILLNHCCGSIQHNGCSIISRIDMNTPCSIVYSIQSPM